MTSSMDVACVNGPGVPVATMTSRRLGDRYILGHEIGVGGMSRVHVALDERLGRRVAVKLHDANAVATADPAGRERFLREGRTTAGFNHRHAVTVFDAGEDAGDLYIVMEFVDGPSLGEHLAQNGPLPIDETVRISRQMLSALAAAHADGLVHRDVKPANILVGAGGDAKLADFGIAKRFDDLGASVTSAGIVIGTPRYLAPEQALGHGATPATDVYALGIVMFEMLTGRLPFDTDPRLAGAEAEQSTALRLLSLRSDAPTALAEVVAWALETQPEERPAAAAMLVALDAASSPRTGSARVADPTLVMPLAVGSTPDGSAATDGSSGHIAGLLFAVLLVLLGGVVAVATLGSRDVVDGTVVTVAPTSTPSVPTAAPTPTTEPGIVEPAVPEPAVAEPAVSEPAVAEPAVIEARVIEVIVPEPLVVTLVPGFAVTDDLEVFLQQVERDPDLLGQSGPELADELRKVIEQRGREQRTTAQNLREVLVTWADDGEIPSAIADALDDLLAPLAK